MLLLTIFERFFVWVCTIYKIILPLIFSHLYELTLKIVQMTCEMVQSKYNLHDEAVKYSQLNINILPSVTNKMFLSQLLVD